MTAPDRNFIPFQRLSIPVCSGQVPQTALAMARNLGGRVQLVGLVQVPAGTSLTAGTTAARAMRKQLEGLRTRLGLPGQNRVLVCYEPWKDLLEALENDPPDLLLLEWPCEELGISQAEMIKSAPCQVAIVRGPWPTRIRRVLVPVRGGPNAELAIRMALALPRQDLVALHLSRPGSSPSTDAPFRGLERILPSLSGVTYQSAISSNPAETILEEARQADVLLLGASGGPHGSSANAFMDTLLVEATSAVVVLKARRQAHVQWTGPEAERAGAQAISLLVDRWFAENTFHAGEFADLERLVCLKQEQNVTISLALPALNEEETVGKVIRTVETP